MSNFGQRSNMARPIVDTKNPAYLNKSVNYKNAKAMDPKVYS
jgi:hypothetical protein